LLCYLLFKKQALIRVPKGNAFEQEQAEEAEKSQYDIGFLSVCSAASLFSKTSIESSAIRKRILTGASRGSREIAV
jgi:hypothetical protein